MKAQKTVLCIQDGSSLDYSRLVQCEGLGVIGTNQTGAKSGGLHLHSTRAITAEGIPLGVLQAQRSAPKPKSKHVEQSTEANAPSSDTLAIEDKKTFNRIVGRHDCVDLAREMPHARLVNVLDREADLFELVDEQRGNPCVELRVRAKHNRGTADGTRLLDDVMQVPVGSRLRFKVPRQSTRPKKSKQKARPGRRQRTADVSLRQSRVELEPPKHLGDREPLPLWILAVTEDSPPPGVEPLGWFLLTTLEVVSADQAKKYLRGYCPRWRIEDWHRVLKSG